MKERCWYVCCLLFSMITCLHERAMLVCLLSVVSYDHVPAWKNDVGMSAVCCFLWSRACMKERCWYVCCLLFSMITCLHESAMLVCLLSVVYYDHVPAWKSEVGMSAVCCLLWSPICLKERCWYVHCLTFAVITCLYKIVMWVWGWHVCRVLSAVITCLSGRATLVCLLHAAAVCLRVCLKKQYFGMLAKIMLALCSRYVRCILFAIFRW